MAKKTVQKRAKVQKIKSKTTEKNTEPSYEAKDIYVLEGLEPVRKRPGMYIGSTGPDGLHHLVWEVCDNSLDEAISGYAKNIKVELLKDNQVAVTDDGRGIPVDIHPQTKKSALETVMTTLHAGGKFGGESYKVSGGLHGVGVSVVCALSKWMRVEVCRDEYLHVQEYEKGKPKFKVKKSGRCGATGTKVVFEPDPEIFPDRNFDLKGIKTHLRQQAYLTKGVRIDVFDKRTDNPEAYGFYFDGGVKSFVKNLAGESRVINDNVFYVRGTNQDIEVEIAFLYVEDVEIQEMSFANNIYTPEGGSHLTGFRSALTRSLNDFGRDEGFIKDSEDNFSGDDVREGLVAVVSVKLREPQFEGQTKAKLGNVEARTAVESVLNTALKEFLELNPSDARKIIERGLLAAKARKAAKAAKETVLRKGALEGLTLPGKLADCTTKNPEESELFIVEGDSAGGCFSGDVKVALTDGRNLSFKDLVKEYAEGKKNYCYTIQHDGNIGIQEIQSPRMTQWKADVLKIVLDNGEEIICTPDHSFMLRDGSYKMAKDLIPTDSLMPLRRKISEIGGRITIKGYEMVFSPMQNRWIFTHLLSDRYNIKEGVYVLNKSKNSDIHHIDFNKLNNNPDNVVRMERDFHMKYHRRMVAFTIHREDAKERCRRIHKSEEYRNKVSRIMSTPEKKKMLRALKTLHSIYSEKGQISIGDYNRVRSLSNDKNLIRYDTICQRFFEDNETRLKEAVINYNHKIKTATLLKEKMDVYDIEVPNTHNFALASGIFVHNSGKQGRDRRFQAILPLRGKILNVEKSRIDKILANKEIKSLVIALGTAVAENFDINRLRYHKVIIMTDADVDGSHIRTLLLTLFYRYFPQIINGGYLFVVQPPLFRLQKGKIAEYAYSDRQRDEILKNLREGVSVQRYKGLGEMNPDQLWETTMDPEKRVLKQIEIEDAMEADRLFDILMGGDVEPRKNFINAHAAAVKNLDI